jgi:hypothetical protein
MLEALPLECILRCRSAEESAIPNPPSPLEDDMPLNAPDKAWVQQEIAASHKRSGFGKLTGAIKDWGGTGAAIAIIIFFLTQWGNYTEFRTRTGDRLDGTEKRLEKIEAGILELRAFQSPEAVLHEINGLEPATFNRALQALRTAVQKPIEANKISQPLLLGIAGKLSKTNPSTPGYWPTVLEFLQFASAGLAPANVPPSGSTPAVKSSSGLRMNYDTFAGVTVLLDGGSLSNSRFDSCRVIFTSTPVTMKNVTFVNSVFEFPVSSAPSPYIQQASKLLLASDLKTTSIPNL